jgi:hypothetical protein
MRCHSAVDQYGTRSGVRRWRCADRQLQDVIQSLPVTGLLHVQHQGGTASSQHGTEVAFFGFVQALGGAGHGLRFTLAGRRGELVGDGCEKIFDAHVRILWPCRPSEVGNWWAKRM